MSLNSTWEPREDLPWADEGTGGLAVEVDLWGGGLDARAMETRVDEGTTGRERRDGRERGKGMAFVALQGGRCMFTRRAHSFIVRMAGRCTAITRGPTGQMAPGLADMKTNVQFLLVALSNSQRLSGEGE